MRKLPLFALLFLLCRSATAQVAQQDVEGYLKTDKFDIDTESSAVVLKETILCVLGYTNDHYSATQKVYRLVKILKQDAVSEGEIQALVDKRLNNGQLYALKGCTYNLEGGEVKKSVLSTGDIFKSDLSKKFSEVRFTLPDIRPGSVIEYSYELLSPALYILPAWQIQENYPKLHTEYAVYNALPMGYHSVLQTSISPKEFPTEIEARRSNETFVHSNERSGHPNMWIMKNVLGLSSMEPFVQNISNHRERLECRVFTTIDKRKDAADNWGEFNALEWNTDKARAIRDRNMFLDDTVEMLIRGKETRLEKARAIFSYVRNNFTRVAYSNWLTGDVKNTFRDRKGQIGHLNVLLAAMLAKAGLECYMMLGSTTETVSPTAGMPMPERFTRTFCALANDRSFLFLDASDPNNVFGMLPPECYNGLSFVVTKKGEFAQLTPDMIEDVSIVSTKVTLPKENVRQVELTYKMGLVTSSFVRKAIAAKDSDEEKVTATFFKEISDDYELKERHLENLNSPDTNLVFKATWTQPFNETAPVFFLQPSLVKARSKNSFPPAKRIHPIEFSYRTKQSYYTTIVLPKGYVIDSVPQGKIFSLDDGNYEYKRTSNYIADMNIVITNVTIANKKVVYDAEDYDNFRAIHEDILKEENRMVEVRKK